MQHQRSNIQTKIKRFSFPNLDEDAWRDHICPSPGSHGRGSAKKNKYIFEIISKIFIDRKILSVVKHHPWKKKLRPVFLFFVSVQESLSKLKEERKKERERKKSFKETT